MPFMFSTRLCAVLAFSALFILAGGKAVWAEAGPSPAAEMALETRAVHKLPGDVDPNASEPGNVGESIPGVRVANAANYVFSTVTTASLADMSGSTTLVAADQDDTASAVTLIGFDFYFQGVRQDRFSVNSNGSLRFGATQISNTAYDPLAQTAQSLVTAYGADQRTHIGDGRVHAKLTGSAPNRVLTIEWLNMQSDFNSGGVAQLTYQVRLFETTGVIDFTYGSMTMGAAGAADPNSVSPQYGFSSNNTVGTVGSITAAQSGTPAPTFSGASATPVNNTYVAGPITALTSAADGARRQFTLTPPTALPPIGPLSFTGITSVAMTLNWGDSGNDSGYAIYQSTDGTNFSFFGTAAENATSFNATGLFGGVTYFWRVYAVTEGSIAFISGTQATATPTPNTALGTGLWSSPGTWSTGSVPGSSDAVTIPSGVTVTIDTAALAYSVTIAGVLQFEQTTARTLTLPTDVTVQSGATFSSNAAGTQTGHNLSLGGNLTNNGTLDFSTNADTAGAIITFTGSNNVTFGGSGATNDIRQITINKGTTPAAIAEITSTNFTVRGVTTDTVVGGWLVMTNGTLKVSGTFNGTSRVFAVAAYTIPASVGFWLNNPNYTVAGQNGSPTNSGQLRISQGVFNIGTATGNSMGFSTGSSVNIEGGAVNAAGRFGVAAAANAISYTQSAGTVTVCTVGNTSTTLGSFDLGTSLASVISLSGGTIVTQINATTIDYRNQAGSGATGVTGGTLQLGNAASGAAKTFNLRGVLPNVEVTNTSAGHTGAMSTTLVNFNNISRSITINTGATFNSGNVVFLFAGTTLTNNGTLTANGASSNFVWFDNAQGMQTYTGTGVTTAPITNTAGQNPANLTLSSTNQFIVARFNLFGGGVIGANKLTIGNGGATTAIVQFGVAGPTTALTGFDVPPVFNPGTGGINLLYAPELGPRTTGNEVPPSRTLNLLSVTNTNPVTLAGGDLTVTGTAAGAIALSGGRVITGANALYFNPSAGTGTVTRTTGYVDGNFRKAYAAAGSKTFEVGSANGYTPVTFNTTAGTFPTDVTVAAVEGPAPGIQPVAKALARYWRLLATGVTADVTVSYLDPTDVPGTLTEANLRFYRHGVLNPSDYSDQGGTIDTALNTATLTGITSFSDWTLAEFGSDLAITKTDGVATASPGGSVTYTVTASNNGPGNHPTAQVADTFPAALTCSTTCAGAGGGTCTAGPFAGNINDTASIPSGGAVTYTSVCNISPSATGSLSNTATVAGGAVPDANTADNSATDTDGLGANADLAITKTDGVTTVTAGGSATYTITASNAGPSNATGATVADTFPASLTCTWTCVGAGGGTCTASGSGNINNTVNLPVGGSVTYTASCTISAAASGSLSNTATVAAPGGVTDPTPANNSATDTDTIARSADLAITKTDGVTTVTAGGSTTYTITSSNAGPSNASGVTVADTFPASLTCTWTCVGAGGGTCTAAGSGNINDTVNLPSGGSVTHTASCTVSAAATGTLSNTATVAAPGGVTDPTPGNNSATDSDTIGASADLSITKTDGVTTATPGGSVTYTITASNAGPSNATGATVADTFPASLTCTWTCVGAGGGTCTASGSGNINNTVNLPSGGSVTHTASCTISGAATGSLVNTATVAAPAGVTDPTPGNNSATDTDTLGATADLSITKTDGVTSATPGGSVTYTITSSNAGPSTATGATVADTFPASLTCTWTCVGAGGGTCTAAGSGNINDTVNLPSGGSVTHTASCTISASATGSLVNTATVTAPAGVTDPTPGNNSATDTDGLGATADLSITKTDGVTTATAGGSVTYTITSSNAGPSNATGATVADTFPASLTCTWTCVGAGGGTCTASGSGNINDTVNLPSGGSVTHTASCAISGSATGSLVNTATVTAPAGVTDPTPGNNSATDTDTLGASADLSITKTDGVTVATPGGSLTYTITASNAGPSTATGATVADTFPAVLTACSWTCAGAGGGTCAAAGSGAIADTVNLPSGGSVTYTAACTVSGSASGSVSNTATVTAPAGVIDPTPANNSATDVDTVDVSADASINVTDGVTTVLAGNTVTYTIVAGNAGPSALASANVTDNFPAPLTGCTWTCTAGVGGTCGSASGSGNLADAPALVSGGSVTYTATCTVPAGTPDATVLTNTANISTGAITDPNPSNDSATDVTTVTALPPAGASVSGTKTVSGSFTSGSTVTYSIVLTNAGPGTQADNAGNEFTDVLPAGLTLVSATASSGTATSAGNTVNWNGTLAAGGSVTITITASISATGGTIVNQGTLAYDSDGNGSNDATGVTDDPGQAGAGNPTGFSVVGVPAVQIAVPALDRLGLLLLMLLLGMAGLLARGRYAAR
jgi:uncharacterized repeat protein (TIGR01451 family)